MQFATAENQAAPPTLVCNCHECCQGTSAMGPGAVRCHQARAGPDTHRCPRSVGNDGRRAATRRRGQGPRRGRRAARPRGARSIGPVAPAGVAEVEHGKNPRHRPRKSLSESGNGHAATLPTVLASRTKYTQQGLFRPTSPKRRCFL